LLHYQIVEILQPKNEFNKKIQDVVNIITKFLIKSLNPLKIIKGGSYGKGTNLCDRKEVDLVIIFNDYIPTKENCTKKIAQIKECIKDLITTEIVELDYYEQCDNKGNLIIKLRSLNFTLDGIKVDLLPGCVLSNGALSFLEFDPKNQLPFASASACQMQIKFIKHQDDRYKNFVRICKCWRDLDWKWIDNSKPSSYLLELLALYVYESIDKKTFTFDFNLQLTNFH
jgi:hypothetical protein